MTTKSSVQVRLETDLKNEAESILENLGLDSPTAIRIFFKKIVATRSLPFTLEEEPYRFSAKQENEALLARHEVKDPANHTGEFSSARDLIRHLHSDDPVE